MAGDGKAWFIPDHPEELVRDAHNTSRVPAVHQQLISDNLMWNLNVYINILLCGSMSMVGTVSNVINMTIFYKLGLKDSMTIYLFALAFTDSVLSFIIVVTRIFPIWDTFFYVKGIDPIAINYVGFEWTSDALYVCSGWITALLSLERCICVTFPFKVKRIFTRSRSIVGVVLVYVVTAVAYLPIYVTHWLGWINVKVNGTVVGSHLVVMFTDNRHEVEDAIVYVSGTVLPVPSMVIVVGSVFWMIYGLQKSSHFRNSMKAGGDGGGGVLDTQGGTRIGSKLDSKTLRLVQVVLAVAICFTICSFPRLFAKYMYLVDTNVQEGGKEENLYVFKWQFTRLGYSVNTSVNIFIYLAINSSYRSMFLKIFSLRSAEC